MSAVTREPSTSGVSVALAGRLGRFTIDAAFEAPASGVTALFGRSGSGKTSILRAMAGLMRLDGRVVVAGEAWQESGRFRPPHQREVGYVFQEASLFPHLSVRGNILFGARRTPKGIDHARFAEIVDLLRIARLLDRPPADLSGGERQRIALARAILARPKLLLMDEPLSALDRMAKDNILPYIEALQGALSIPVLYVSHDIGEVERLADRIVVLEEGRVAAAGPLNEALVDSGLGFVRDPHSAAILPATVIGYDVADGLCELSVGGQRLFVEGSGLDAPGAKRRLRLEASDVSLTREPSHRSTILNRLAVRIERIDESGAANLSVLLSLRDAPELRFLARVTRRSARLIELHTGETLTAQIKSVSLATARRLGD